MGQVISRMIVVQAEVPWWRETKDSLGTSSLGRMQSGCPEDAGAQLEGRAVELDIRLGFLELKGSYQ